MVFSAPSAVLLSAASGRCRISFDRQQRLFKDPQIETVDRLVDYTRLYVMVLHFGYLVSFFLRF